MDYYISDLYSSVRSIKKKKGHNAFSSAIPEHNTSINVLGNTNVSNQVAGSAIPSDPLNPNNETGQDDITIKVEQDADNVNVSNNPAVSHDQNLLENTQSSITQTNNENDHNEVNNHNETNSEQSTDAEVTRKTKIKCVVCGKVFGKGYYERHLSLHNPTRKSAKNKSKKACPKCGKLYSNFKKHMLVHEDTTAKCDTCEKQVKLSAMQRHKRLHEIKGKETMVCYQCGKSFCGNASYSRHMVTHGDKEHKCQVCGTSFYFLKYLKRHMRSHTGEKPFACTYCDKTFSIRWNLHQHLRLHTDSKPYKCKLCLASFRHNVTLKGHLRMKHSASEIAMINADKENDEQEIEQEPNAEGSSEVSVTSNENADNC